MPWSWELPNWPHFTYEISKTTQQEKQFLLKAGGVLAVLKNINDQDYHQFIVEILSIEGVESSRIEGEILDRESFQSSLKKQLRLHNSQKQQPDKESQMAEILSDVYASFDKPLTHEMLWEWHSKLFSNQAQIADCGKYRTHAEPMQIVSHRYDSPRVFFEAPPSPLMIKEMETYVNWFNATKNSLPILLRAAIAHLYFESIHPFEDGNGRIGRVLVEKVLSQGVGRPVLIAVSKVLEKRKKEYYAALGRCNRTLDAEDWVEFFANTILQAQNESMGLLNFLIQKSKMLQEISEKINSRQEKVLLRMFAEGLNGFKGGLSAENYIAITKASRATATRDLADLVELGALVKTGQLRHTRYRLNIPNNS